MRRLDTSQIDQLGLILGRDLFREWQRDPEVFAVADIALLLSQLCKVIYPVQMTRLEAVLNAAIKHREDSFQFGPHSENSARLHAMVDRSTPEDLRSIVITLHGFAFGETMV